MTAEEPTLEQRVTKIEGEILDLRGRSNVQAWLHAELVHELQFIFARLVGSRSTGAATPVEAARVAEIRQRAVRLARIRAKQQAAPQVRTP